MSRPLAVRRHHEIMRRLNAAGAVTVAELADDFGVSHETIRRDLKLLAERGQLAVVHGGAARRGEIEIATCRVPGSQDALLAIGRAAAALVEDGATVALDAGPATMAVAHELIARPGLTVCTNSLAIALLLCRVSGTRVFMLGGEVDGADQAISGTDAIAAIDNFRVDIAFIGVAGFAEDGGGTGCTRGGAELRGRMILSGHCYALADHGCFAHHTPFRIPHFEKLAGIIVDRAPDAALAAAWAAAGLRMMVAA